MMTRKPGFVVEEECLNEISHFEDVSWPAQLRRPEACVAASRSKRRECEGGKAEQRGRSGILQCAEIPATVHEEVRTEQERTQNSNRDEGVSACF